MRFHVISDELIDSDKELLKGIASRREGTELFFYSPAAFLSNETLDKIDFTVKRKGRQTREAYYKLFAPDLLPQDAHRALYLDGDIVCTGSLDELFETDLKGLPLGMSIDISGSHIWTYNRLGYPQQEGYFNTGVILFDLDLWRKEGLAAQCLDYLNANAGKLLIIEQDLINAVLHGRVFRLESSYNLDPPCHYVFYWLKEEENGYYASETQFLPKDEWPALKAAVEAPSLVHFWGAMKPWHRECDNPYAPVWRYFWAQSPWRDEPLKSFASRLPAKARLKRRGRRALERLGLMAPIAVPYPKEACAIAEATLGRLLAEDAAAGRG